MKIVMKKLEKTSELLWVFGIIFVALGVAICSKANLGVSMIAAPAFIVYEAVSFLWHGFSVGMVEYMLQGVMLILLCVIIRKFNWKYLLAFLVAFIYGYVLDFFLWVLSPLSFETAFIKWAMLIVGDIVTAFGVACFFRTYMPLQVYELFVALISKTFNIKISKVKTVFDYSLLTISIILACTLFGDLLTFNFTSILTTSYHSVGLGTLVTTLINSPIISLAGKLLDKIFIPTPKFEKLKTLICQSD